MARRCDYLVIGAGLAGLSYALRVAEHGSVLVLVKAERKNCNTAWAQGGIAAVWKDDEDSFESHVADTFQAGADLNAREAVEAMVRKGPERIRHLIELGVRFTRGTDIGEEGEGYHLTREGGHSARRILHAGDLTGAEIHRAVLAAAEAHPNIEIQDNRVVVDLITRRKARRHLAKRALGLRNLAFETSFTATGPEQWGANEQDRCLGAYVLQPDGSVETVLARVTMLATGGAGKLYRYTSNPNVATGDGMAMAWRAGATLANMEFVQFHPTCLYHHSERGFLITEALRGEGARLRLPDGTRFMADHHALGELAPRDIVARAIDYELTTRGLDHVLLDATHLGAPFLESHFPHIVARLRAIGIDPVHDPIPVVPAAHYFCGGVKVDLAGQTDLPGLLAAGEVTCSGVHGANRLASNSLLEAVVWGHEAAGRAIELTAAAAPVEEAPEWDPGTARDSDEAIVILHNWDEVRRVMSHYVGIVRSDKRLARAMKRLTVLEEEIDEYYWDFLVTRDLIELRNLVIVARLVVTSALIRRESRGLHYNLDCRERDDERWLRDTDIRKSW